MDSPNQLTEHGSKSDISLGLQEDFLEEVLANAKPEVKQILLDPAILHRFKKALDKLIAGEDKNKLLLFSVACTSFMKKGVLGAIIIGESSAGKSHLMNSVLKFFGNVEEYTRITKASPDRLERSFCNKILKVEELRGTEQAQSSLRVLISEGQLKLLTTTRGENGNITTEELVTNGIPCFITSTTRLKPDEELLNRLFIISIDETEAQTKKVLEYEALEFTDPDFEDTVQPPQELLDVLEFLALSPFNEYLIPFADQLARKFPSKNVKARRDFKKLLYIIGAVAFLHQMQRPKVYRQKVPQYTVALPADFYMAWEIAAEGMKETLLNVQKRSLEVLELFEDPNVDSLTSRQVATMTQLSQSRAREILNSLVDFGYLIKDTSKKEHSFSLKKNIDVNNTLGNFEALYVDFDENKFEEWLVKKNLKTRYRVWVNTWVHPITGEVLSCAPSRVLKKTETEQKPSVKQQNSQKETSKTTIVASLSDLVAVYWNDRFFGEHECGVCGYKRMTSWRAETNKGAKIPICEDCVGAFEEQRGV